MKRFITIYFILIMMFFSLMTAGCEEQNVAYAEENNIIKNEEIEISKEVFEMLGETISSIQPLRGLDGQEDYIYMEFEEDGYAVFFRDTFEMLEYSPKGNLLSAEDLLYSEVYYCGPGELYLCENDCYINMISKEKLNFTIAEASNKAESIKGLFSKRSSNVFYKDLSGKRSENNLQSNAPPFDNSNRIKIPYANGTYIPNYRYFLSNPYHGGINGESTCGAVAAQLMLGYYNYYIDRRIIQDTYLFLDNDGETKLSSYADPVYLGDSEIIGSTDSFYTFLIGYVQANSSGASTRVSLDHGIGLFFNSTPASGNADSDTYFPSQMPSNIITDTVDEGEPIIIGMRAYLGAQNHFAVAYGYTSYTYLNNQGTYMGYITHVGDQFSESLNSVNVWINSAWCDQYVKINVNHTHNYDTYIGGSYNEIKCSTCGHRRYAYTTNILSNTEVEITGNMVDMTESVTMPDKINGRTVTKIANNAFKQRHLTGAVLPAHLTHIGNNAFYLCPALTTVTLPTTLQSIGVCAFSLSALESVYIPSNVTEIKDNAFSFCAIETLGFSSSSHLTTIGVGAFGLCLNLKRVTIPSSVVSIGNGAFQFDNKLEEVNFSSSPNLETIGYEAFASCTKLEKFIIPPSVESIGQSAFANNSSMTYVSIPSTLLELGANAFKNCSQLTIYNEHRNFPVNWSSSWNSSGRPVFWTTDLDNSKTYVLHFYKTNTNPANTTGISSPIRSGFTFGGWYTSSDFSGTQYTSETIGDAPNNTWLYAKWTSSSCIAAGSLITLADGSQVAVENLTGNENLLVWNMLTGQYDTAPILFIDSDPLSSYEIIKLTFSDNTEVKVIDEHAFFDMTIGEYVFMRNDASQYIGHYFNKQGINGTYATVQLINVTVYNETTTAWSPVTYGHLCYYVNGMLSMPGGTEGLINIFDVDTTLMKYDAVQMSADIQTYGLYTYEEFNAIIPLPELVFNAFNGQYLKVSIGKGLITLDEIAALLERYAAFFE